MELPAVMLLFPAELSFSAEAPETVTALLEDVYTAGPDTFAAPLPATAVKLPPAGKKPEKLELDVVEPPAVEE
jgi:hypothetical protein